MTMEHLLAIVDQRHADSPAFRSAVQWSRILGARLSVFLPADLTSPEGLTLGSGLLASVEHTAELDAEHWLEDFLARESASIGRHAVASRHWVQAVCHEVERMGADMIFISRESAPNSAAWKKLLRQLPAPTCIVRDTTTPQSILAAVSAIPEDAVHQVLNDTVLNYAVRLRDLWQVELKVASALPSAMEIAPMMGETYAVSYVQEEMETSLREALRLLLEKHGLKDDILCLRMGVVEAVLAQELETVHANWVIMGTVGRRALTAFFSGNSAEQVERHVPANLLLLRPQDFSEL
ncbi:MAG: universal stress protein [Pseudomonadales bacterium]|nr:universal stress protein [Pseudomonadales bacterium]